MTCTRVLVRGESLCGEWNVVVHHRIYQMKQIKEDREDTPLHFISDTKGIQWVDTDATLRINGCTEGFPLHFYEFTRSTQEKTDLRIGPSVLPFSDNLYSTLAGTSANTSRSTSP